MSSELKFDRRSAASAAATLETCFPDPDIRQQAARLLTDCIERAASARSDRWSCTLFPSALRLNVGGISICALGPGLVQASVRLEALASDRRAEVEKLGLDHRFAHDAENPMGTRFDLGPCSLGERSDLGGDPHRYTVGETMIKAHISVRLINLQRDLFAERRQLAAEMGQMLGDLIGGTAAG